MSYSTPVTLRDLAKKSGYHFTTVGAALRGDVRIPEATRERIRRLAEKAGYRANPVLSALSAYRSASQKKHLAGVIGYLAHYRPTDSLRKNPRERRLLQAAKKHAESLSFKLEIIQIDPAEISPARVNALLHARGIKAVILGPRLPGPGPIMELEWEAFTVVAIGYSITNLRAHRACYHQSHAMLLNLQELRARGYRRIGLAISEQAVIRSNTLFLGAYLAEQCRRPRAERIPPLIAPEMEVSQAALVKWVRRYKPDGVIVTNPDTVDWLQRAGLRVPEDIGVSHLSRESLDSALAGVDEQSELLGEAAIDLTVSLVRANERGLPAHPRYSLVDARWVDGPTVRPREAPEKGEVVNR